MIEVNGSLNVPKDDELFDSSLLDSLNKLTDEIQEDLLTDDGSEDSDSYRSGEYTDDDEDPDSGENQLFTMMDDLVTELQMELKDEETDGAIEADTEPHVVVESEKEETTADQQNEDEPYDTSDVEHVPVICEPSAATVPAVDRERLEKQRRLHVQVKSLLQRVTVLAHETETDRVTEDAPANGARKRVDSSADRLEQLLGALSSYSNPPAQDSTQTTISEDQAKTAKAMSSYTQRRRREYLLRKQASRGRTNTNGQNRPSSVVAGQQSTTAPRDSTVQSGIPSTSPTSSRATLPNRDEKKKRKPRTNKHKKRTPRMVSPDTSRSKQQQHPMDQQQHLYHHQQQAYYSQHDAEHASPIPQQSLRALLTSLVALDEKLSEEPTM